MKSLSPDIEKKYFSIGEVAKEFDVAPSLIRFWETHFDTIRPRKTKNGTRQYTKADIEKIRTIYHLVKTKGYTLQGAKEAMSNRPDLKAEVLKSITTLEEIKQFLVELRERLE
ncbi:MAG: MerR family transcriptional regulator [Bernardetiaceae bacterium]|jgi:DNA-binding transcriptional MerR regulator|nr:MerR family transcriptional regulator [Bernardetiaceae bacterium]